MDKKDNLDLILTQSIDLAPYFCGKKMETFPIIEIFHFRFLIQYKYVEYS